MRLFFLGVDGGGTRCRARIRDDQGQCLAEAEGGLSNVYQDFPGAILNIRATAEDAARQAGVAIESLHAGLALAGVTSETVARRVEAAGLPFSAVTVAGDAHPACLGAHGGRDGGIVISGTGSGGYVIVNGKGAQIGSMGFELGDQGSGAMMGRALLRRAVLALDALAEPTALLQETLATFSHDRQRLLDWAQGAFSRDYAAFAPAVLAAARAGDVHGLEIVRHTATGVDRLADGLMRRGARQIALIGSIAAALQPWLAPRVTAHIVPAKADPADGGIIMARRAAGLEDMP